MDPFNLDDDLEVHMSFIPGDEAVSLSMAPVDQQARSPYAWLRRLAAWNADCPPELLIGLSADDDESVRWAAASNPHLPASEVPRLVRDPNPGVRDKIAGHPAATGYLTGLAADTEDRVRVAAATHLDDPAELGHLAADRKATVRTAVAGNPHTSDTTLADLATDRSKFVRRAVAQNPSTPGPVLTVLASDKEADTRDSAFVHPHAPDDVRVRGLGSARTRTQVIHALTDQLLIDTIDSTARMNVRVAALTELITRHGGQLALTYLDGTDKQQQAAVRALADHADQLEEQELWVLLEHPATPPGDRATVLTALAAVAGPDAVTAAHTHPDPHVQAAALAYLTTALT